MAYVVERWWRALSDPRDHLAGGVRAVLPRARRDRRAAKGEPRAVRPAGRSLWVRVKAGDDSGAAGAVRVAHGGATYRRLDALSEGYSYDHAWTEERLRLAGLESA